MLRAGRVGVAPTEVDAFGHITGGSSGGYTKEEADSKFATKSNTYTKSVADGKFETKANIGGLQFRDNDGTAQYKLPDGDWTNFSSGSGGVGMNLTDPVTTGINQGFFVSITDGGYQIVDGVCYLKMKIRSTVEKVDNVKLFESFPKPVDSAKFTAVSATGNVPLILYNFSSSAVLLSTNGGILAANTDYDVVGQYKVAV